MRRAGAICRKRLAGAAAFARAEGLAPGRAERFRSRQNAASVLALPTLGDLAGWPAWPSHDEAARRQVFAIAALLASRDGLSGLVSGSELRAYAATIGEDMLERVLAWPRAGAAPLPAAERLERVGQAIAAAELPPRLAGLLPPDPAQPAPAQLAGTTDPRGAWIAEAERLMTAGGRL